MNLLGPTQGWSQSAPLTPLLAAQVGVPTANPFPRRVAVADFPAGLTWMNTAGPLRLSDLRGKFVLLDFWTYCCINCMHILPELKKLEQQFARQLVVIGVHSAKFEAERADENLQEAILRYGIEHPVLNDPGMLLWRRFGVNTWPTIVLIDPQGQAVFTHSGEFRAEQMQTVLEKAIPYYRAKGQLSEIPLRFDLLAPGEDNSPLRFPGKVLADEPGNRLFIADSGQHRIVVTTLDGRQEFVIGSGQPGRRDGSFRQALFHDPQGMARAGDRLYVADTGNHSIRVVDLQSQRVQTIAGTGRQATQPWPGWRGTPGQNRPKGGWAGPPRRTALASPWDLWIHQQDLFIAMAGSHQIWRMPLDASSIGPYAGNGREDIVDGRLLPRTPYGTGFSSFAQPSGLGSDGQSLFVADSEGSSIRSVPFDARGQVKTVLGTANLAPAKRLFTFGDLDGPIARAKLQHPLAVVYHANRLYVADTYNNKVKTVDLPAGRVATLAGTGEPGSSNSPARFNEPAGLSFAAGRLLVADTNNHKIRTIMLSDPPQVGDLELTGVTAVQPAESASAEDLMADDTAVPQEVEPQQILLQGGPLPLVLKLDLAAGYKLNPLAPIACQLRLSQADQLQLVGPLGIQRLTASDGPWQIPLLLQGSGRGTLEVALVCYYCRTGSEAICRLARVRWTVPIEVSSDRGSPRLTLEHRLPDVDLP